MTDPERKPNQLANKNLKVLLPNDFDSFYETLRNSVYSKNLFNLSNTQICDELLKSEETNLKYYSNSVGNCFESTITLSENIINGPTRGFYTSDRIEKIRDILTPLTSNYIELADKAKTSSDISFFQRKNRIVRGLVINNGVNKFVVDFGTINYKEEEEKLKTEWLQSKQNFKRDDRWSEREYQDKLEQYNSDAKYKEEEYKIKVNALYNRHNSSISIKYYFDSSAGYAPFRSACRYYAVNYGVVINALYKEAKYIPPARIIDLKYPPFENKVVVEEVKKEEIKPVKEEFKIPPEDPNKGIKIVIPEPDNLYEYIRNCTKKFDKHNGSLVLPINETAISNSVFQSIKTNFIIETDHNSYKLIEYNIELIHSPLKLSINHGYYDEAEQKLIKTIIVKRCQPNKIKNAKDADNFYNFNFGEVQHGGIYLRLGGCSQEVVKTKLIENWTMKNERPQKKLLSEREYQIELENYRKNYDSYIESIRNIPNVSLNIWSPKVSFGEFNQEYFNETLESFAYACKAIIEAISIAEGFDIPDIEINLVVPDDKMEQPVENIILVSADGNSSENIKEMVELHKLENKKKYEWDGFEAIGGQDLAVAEAKKLVNSIQNPEINIRRGVKPTKGILFYGPPGTGKTTLSRAIAKETGAEFMDISCANINEKWHGESERNMQQVFDTANSLAKEGRKVILLFDNIDALALKRNELYDASRKVLTVMLNNLEEIRLNKNVTVIAATNNIEDIDPAIKRSGRFDKLIEVGLPNQEGRISILKKHMEKAKKRSTQPQEVFAEEINLENVAKLTEGMSGADLENLVNLTLEEKADKEITGLPWTPVTTEEILVMIDKMGRNKIIQKKLGFV